MSKPKIRLTITINEDGTASADGPINDKLLSYGLLEVGKELVRAHHEQLLKNEGEKKIVAAPPEAAAAFELTRLRGEG